MTRTEEMIGAAQTLLFMLMQTQKDYLNQERYPAYKFATSRETLEWLLDVLKERKEREDEHRIASGPNGPKFGSDPTHYPLQDALDHLDNELDNLRVNIEVGNDVTLADSTEIKNRFEDVRKAIEQFCNYNPTQGE